MTWHMPKCTTKDEVTDVNTQMYNQTCYGYGMKWHHVIRYDIMMEKQKSKTGNDVKTGCDIICPDKHRYNFTFIRLMLHG